MTKNMKTLTYKPTDNPSTSVHRNQQSISDIDTQRIEVDKGMLIANTLKGANASWLVTTIKATLKIQVHKFEKPLFSLKRTHEAAVSNSKILAAFKGGLGAAIASHKYSPVNYGSEFCDTTALSKLFLHHEGKNKVINIIKHRSCYHIDPI